MPKQRVANALTAVVAVALGLVMPAIGTAAPGDGGQVAIAPVLSLASVGGDSTIALYGAEGVASFSLPVSPGLVPASIDALLEIPVDMAAGTLTVTQGERTLSRTALPVADRTPISISLADALIVDDAVTVVLRTYLTPADGYCFDPSNPLRLVDPTIRYDGIEVPPTTVADFLPPVLQQLDVYLPVQPSRAETAAAIRFATAVVSRYGKQRVDIAVLPIATGGAAPPGPSLPLQRQVVIREGADTGVSLLGTEGVPSLLITGPAGELANQTRLLSGDLSRLAVSARAVAGESKTSSGQLGDTVSLRDLGQRVLTASALSPQISVLLDQTRFGRPVQNVRVQLRGSYTPLPAAVGGQLVAAIGGEVIDRWPADSSGGIDHAVDVPDRLLQRDTNLGVTLQMSGNTGRCGDFQPETLTIDGDTGVQSAPASRPLPSGMQSLPQALMPVIQVGVNDGIDDARRATSILVALQRLSGQPIASTVVDVKDALASSNSAVIVSSNGWTDNRLTLPIAVDTGGTITVASPDGSGTPTTLKLDPASAFGSLQTVYDGSRTVLVATSNGAPEQLDALLGWINSDAARWSRVTGSALIAMPGREPVAFGEDDPGPVRVAPPADRSALYWGIGAGVILLGAIGATAVLLRRRRTGAA